MGHDPNLWFDAAGMAEVRRRAAAGHALTRGILARCRAEADPTGPRGIGALAAIALAEADAAAADRLAEHLLSTSAYRQDLGLAHRCLQLAIAHECCAGLWDDRRRDAIRAQAAALVGQLRHRTSSHNPHAVQNNWWGVTHGGALLAALIGGGEEEVRWALGRCLAFCQHFGPAGLYHEGLGYQLYTLSHLLPALTAAHGRGLVDLAEACPWLPRLAESVFAATSPRPAVTDSTEPASGYGMMLSWNDAGLAWGSGIVSPLMLAWAEPTRRPALAAWSLALEGGPQGGWWGEWEGWPIALALPPDAWLAATAEAKPLRRHVCDSRQGLAIFRDRWQDGDDAVLGCYARTSHAGGHSQDDGGSVRFMALGHDWIIGGGQNRPDAAWQSVVIPAARGRRKAGLGAVLWDEASPDGGVFAMDLRKVSDSYHERYIALAGNGRLGQPAVVALLDLIDDHLDRAWTWRITHPADLVLSLDADGRGFALQADDGALARFRFLGAAPTAIRRESTPASRRTYSNGVAKDYPPRPVVAADFAPAPHLAILVGIAVGRGDVPVPTSAGGVDIAIGGQIWTRPFSVAVPTTFNLDRAGTLSRWADGRRGG